MPTPYVKPVLTNHEKVRRALELNEINLPELAEITGYSVETLRGFAMPDRSSPRACKVTDRFIEFMNLKLLAHDKKTV